MSLGDYFSIGGSYFNYNGNNTTLKNSWGNIGLTLRNSWGYLGYTYTINAETIKNTLNDFDSNGILIDNNYFSNSIQLGLNFKNISPFINIMEFDSDWSISGGVSLLDFYGFDLTYQYSRVNKENIHSISLGVNLPYLDFGMKTDVNKFNSIYVSFYSQREKHPIFESSNYWLKIKLDGQLSEIGNGGIINGDNYSFIDLLTIIKKSSKDNYIKGILFEIDKPSLSSAQAEELIDLLKKSNIKYRVYLKENSLGDYLLAATSNKTVMHPAIDLSINGPNITIMFYKNLMTSLGVKAYFFKRGNYKSAPETYTESGPSKYSVEEMDKLVSTIKTWIESIIKINKNISDPSKILDESPYSGIRAKKLSLIYDIAYLDDFEDELTRNGVEIITPSLYNTMFLRNLKMDNKTKIAILTIDGEITENKGLFLGFSENYRNKILNSIKEIKNDPFIDGVIVRINSPGGSGFVSDEIHHAIKKLREKKHVYISIGGVSASGGYYISVAGDKIFANKMSIVGSIGVYTGKLVIKDLLSRLMIGVFTKSIWKNGNLNSMFNLLTDEQIKKMDETVSDFYDIFLSRVNEGRGISIEKLKNEIAGGRIYLGEQSKDIHLIDEIGGFYDALNALIKNNNLSEDIVLDAYPRNDNFLFNLLSDEKKLLFKLNTMINLLNSPNLLLSDYNIEF
jgi:protease-4